MFKQLSPCWILSTPRSGSTYLSHILNHTNWFNPRFSELLGWKQGRYPTVQSLIVSPPRYCKVLHVQLNRLFLKPELLQDIPPFHPLQDQRLNLSHRIILERCLPKIKFVRTNRNSIDQAVSYFVASKASQIGNGSYFNILSKSRQEEFQSLDIQINDQELWEYFLLAERYRTVWDSFLEGASVYTVDYESITPQTICEILAFIGISISQSEAHEAIEQANQTIFAAAQTHKGYLTISDRLHKLIEEKYR